MFQQQLTGMEEAAEPTPWLSSLLPLLTSPSSPRPLLSPSTLSSSPCPSLARGGGGETWTLSLVDRRVSHLNWRKRFMKCRLVIIYTTTRQLCKHLQFVMYFIFAGVREIHVQHSREYKLPTTGIHHPHISQSHSNVSHFTIRHSS